MALEKIAAIYQCYQKPQCVNFVLENFRLNYPNSTAVLVCDGGLNFTDVAKKYNCTYLHKEKIPTEKNLVFKSIEGIKIYAERIKEALSYINEEYFIILEDDVWVKGKITEPDLKFDINGCNYNEGFGYMLREKLCVHRPELRAKAITHYGACGGSVLKTEFFKKILSANIENDIEEYYYNSVVVASDSFLSYLCWRHNGTIGNYSGFCETWHKDYKIRTIYNNIEVLHQYKDLYNE